MAEATETFAFQGALRLRSVPPARRYGEDAAAAELRFGAAVARCAPAPRARLRAR